MPRSFWEDRPAVVADRLDRVKRLAVDLTNAANVVLDAYEELYEAAYSQTSTGDGPSGNRRGAPIGDPTGDVATSGLHRKMRWRLRRVARTLRKVDPILQAAENEMAEAFAETDPEMQAKLKRLRELEDEIDAAGVG